VIYPYSRPATPDDAFRNSWYRSAPSELYIVVQQPHFLSGLESWQANVGAAIASECISQGTVSTASDLALDGKIHLGKFISIQFESIQGSVGVNPSLNIFGLDLLLEPASAVLARPSSLASLGSTLRSCIYLSECLLAHERKHHSKKRTLNNALDLILLGEQIVFIHQFIIFAGYDWNIQVISKVYKANARCSLGRLGDWFPLETQ
jgi:hypothetical protein